MNVNRPGSPSHHTPINQPSSHAGEAAHAQAATLGSNPGLKRPPPAVLKSEGLIRRRGAPHWLKEEFRVKQTNDAVLKAMALLGAKKNDDPVLTDEMVNAALACNQKDKLEALKVLASHNILDITQLAKKVFKCEEEDLFLACSTGLAFGDRTKLNTIKLLLDQEIFEPYVGEAERITGLSPLLNPLMRMTQNPPHKWAENESLDFPSMQERLDTIPSQRKFKIFQSIAPALELKQERVSKRRISFGYHTDTHGISCSWNLKFAMRDLGYEFSENEFRMPISQDLYERNRNGSRDFHGAIENFKRVCELPADRTLSNNFERLVAHLNLLCIYHDDKFRQPEEKKQKNAMQATRQALACARLVPEEHLTHRGVQEVIAKIYQIALSFCEHFPEDEQAEIEQDSIQLMQTNKKFLQTAYTPFYQTIFQKKFLFNPDFKSRNEFANSLTEAEEKTGLHSGFRKAIWTQEWKNAPTMETLEKILKIPSLSTLEYFDLFLHAQDSEAKQKIAQKVASVHKPLFEHTRNDGYLPPAEEALSRFGLSLISAYHLLQKNDPPPSLDFLDKTLLRLDACADLLKKNSAFHGSQFIRSRYNDKDIQLLINIAFQAKSVQVDLSSSPFLRALCEERDPAFQKEIGRWASRVWNDLQKPDDFSRNVNDEFHQIHEEFAQHCRDELERLEELNIM